MFAVHERRMRLVLCLNPSLFPHWRTYLPMASVTPQRLKYRRSCLHSVQRVGTRCCTLQLAVCAQGCPATAHTRGRCKMIKKNARVRATTPVWRWDFLGKT